MLWPFTPIRAWYFRPTFMTRPPSPPPCIPLPVLGFCLLSLVPFAYFLSSSLYLCPRSFETKASPFHRFLPGTGTLPWTRDPLPGSSALLISHSWHLLHSSLVCCLMPIDIFPWFSADLSRLHLRHPKEIDALESGCYLVLSLNILDFTDLLSRKVNRSSQSRQFPMVQPRVEAMTNIFHY